MEKKINDETNFIKNILYIIMEKQNLSLPPTNEDVRSAYSTGVLVALLSSNNLMYGIPLDGKMIDVLEKETLTKLVENLGLSKEFQELKDGQN